MPNCNCHPPFPRPEPFSPLPRPGHVPDWGKWIRDRLSEKGALLAFPSASAFPDPGAQPNVYEALDTGTLYRWDGTHYQVLVDPSAANDVLEYEDRGRFPETGEHGKLYIAADTGILYRWGGEGYVALLPGKADKAVPQTAGNLAALTQDGNLADSGAKPADFVGKAALFDNPDTSPTVKSSLLPSYVDDVVEVADYASLPNPGEEGKIYVTKDTNVQYRWSGTQYTEIAKMVYPATTAPEIAGTAAVGSSARYAREDHVHPAETEVTNSPSIPDSFFPITYTYNGTVHEITKADYENGNFVVYHDLSGAWTLDIVDLGKHFQTAWFDESTLIYLGLTGGLTNPQFNGVTPVSNVSPALVAPGVFVRSVQVAKEAEFRTALAGKLDKTEADEKFIAKSDVASTVTKEGTNPVKSSGIWSAIWGALSALPTGFSSLYDWCVAQLAGKASTADATLTERGLGEWSILHTPLTAEQKAAFYNERADAAQNDYAVSIGGSGPYALYVGAYNVGSLLASGDGNTVSFSAGSPEATTIWGPAGTVVATRTALPGYQLGSQTDKPLASEAEAEALRNGKLDKTAVVAPSTSASDSGKAADAKATGDALGGKASTADATLTERGPGKDGFSAWTIFREGVDVTAQVAAMPRWIENVGWFVESVVVPGDVSSADVVDAGQDALYLEWMGLHAGTDLVYTATRTALPGYQLGSQTDKLLASEAEAEALRNGKLDKSGGTMTGLLTLFRDAIGGGEFFRLQGGEDQDLRVVCDRYNFYLNMLDGEERAAIRIPKADGVFALTAGTGHAGNLAALDANGNPTDSGVKASDKLDSISAAPAFSSDSSVSYAVGSHCTYNGKLYKCTTATTGGTWDASKWTADTMTDPDAVLDITAQNQLRVVAKDGTVLWAQGYDLASTSSATLACDATNNFTFADGATSQAFTLPTAPTGKVGDFGLDIDNSANTGAATMTLTGLDTTFSVVVPEGESLTDMLTIAAGELARFYITLSTFRVNNLPTWHIVKQVVENGGATV